MTAYAGKASGMDYTQYLEQEDYYYKKGDGNTVYGNNAQADALRGLKSLEQKAVFDQYVVGRNGKKRDLYATEIVFSPPKTVSFAAMHKDEKVRDIAVSAHRSAVKEAMEEVEKHHFHVRKWEHGRQENYKATGMVGVGFDHFMNREGEPQLHTHLLIANSGFIPGEDESRSVNFDSIYANQKRFDRIYQAKLQYELEKNGIKTETVPGEGTFEIAGIDRAKVLAKSTRSLQVEANTRKLIIAQKLNEKGFKTKFTPDGVEQKGKPGKEKKEAFEAAKKEIENSLEGQDIRKISTAEQRTVAAKMYRKSKKSVDQEEARKQIAKDLEQLGVDIKIGEKMAERKPSAVRELIYKGYVNYIGKEGISNRGNAVANILEYGIMERNKDKSLPMITHADIDQHLAGAMEKEEMVRLPGQKIARGDNKELLVSKKLLRADVENQEYLKQGNDRYKFLDTSHVDDDLQKALDDGLFNHDFAGEQKVAALGILKSKNFITAVQGDPGTGKTTMMKAIVAVQGNDSIIAVSKAGSAADKLGKEIDVPAQTIDKFVIDYKTRQKLQRQLQKNEDPLTFKERRKLKDTDYIEGLKGTPEKPALIIVDEASMCGDLDLNRLAKIADETSAKIVLAGDMRQLPGVGCGEVFKKFQETGHMETYALKDIYRQKDAGYKAAVEAITIANDLRKAVKLLEKKPDSLKEIKSEKERVDRIQYDYVNRIKAGENPLLITGRNQDKDVLNEGLRPRLKKIDSLDKTGEEHNVFYDAKGNNRTIELCPRERIVFLENDNHRKIKTSSGEKILNGFKGVIDTIENGKITGRMVDENNNPLEDSFTFSVKNYNRIDYGYASTIYKSQGQSVDQHVMYHAPSDSNMLSKNEYLVGTSRNKNNMSVYTDDINSMVKKATSWVVKKDALQAYEKGIQRTEGKSEKVIEAVKIAEAKYERNDVLKAQRKALEDEHGGWKNVPQAAKDDYSSAAEASRIQFHNEIKGLGILDASRVDTKSEFLLSHDVLAWDKNLELSDKKFAADRTRYAMVNHIKRLSTHDNNLCRQIVSLKGNDVADRQCLQDYEDIKKDLVKIRTQDVFKTAVPVPLPEKVSEQKTDPKALLAKLNRCDKIDREILSLRAGLSDSDRQAIFNRTFKDEDDREAYQECLQKIFGFNKRFNELQDLIVKNQFHLDKAANQKKPQPKQIEEFERRHDALINEQTDVENRKAVYQNRLDPMRQMYSDALKQEDIRRDKEVDALFVERDSIEQEIDAQAPEKEKEVAGEEKRLIDDTQAEQKTDQAPEPGQEEIQTESAPVESENEQSQDKENFEHLSESPAPAAPEPEQEQGQGQEEDYQRMR